MTSSSNTGSRRTSRAAIGASAAVAAALVAAASWASGGLAGAASDTTAGDGSAAECSRPLKAATVAGDSGSQGYTADEMGFYEQQGLDVEVVLAAGVPELAAAVQSGDAQFALSSPASVAAAAAAGIPFRMVTAGALYTAEVPGVEVMVGTDSGIETYADLAGRKVAVNALNTAPHLSALAAIDDVGVDVNEVEFIVLNFPAIGQAIESGQVDAGVVTSPFYESIEEAGIGFSIGSSYDAVNDTGDFMNTVWFTTADFIENEPGCVELFVAAIVATSEWANDEANFDERKAILQQYTGMSDEAIASLTPLMFGTEATAELVQPLYDVMFRFGAVEAEIDAASLIGWPA